MDLGDIPKKITIPIVLNLKSTGWDMYSKAGVGEPALELLCVYEFEQGAEILRNNGREPGSALVVLPEDELASLTADAFTTLAARAARLHLSVAMLTMAENHDPFGGSPPPPLDAMPPGTLNPGITKTVNWLRSQGFNTCDSGDGVTRDFDCDRGYAYVSISVTGGHLVNEARRLMLALKSEGVDMSPDETCEISIQATYDPVDGTGLIDLVGMDDERFGEANLKANPMVIVERVDIEARPENPITMRDVKNTMDMIATAIAEDVAAIPGPPASNKPPLQLLDEIGERVASQRRDVAPPAWDSLTEYGASKWSLQLRADEQNPPVRIVIVERGGAFFWDVFGAFHVELFGQNQTLNDAKRESLKTVVEMQKDMLDEISETHGSLVAALAECKHSDDGDTE